MPTPVNGSLLGLVPVIPVVTITEVSTAVPLARALSAGGARLVEVTLRTPAALDGLRSIAGDVPDVVVGAGTVIRPDQAAAAAAAGAQFLVSPGSPRDLVTAMVETGLPVLPGVSTPSEVMSLLEQQHEEMKFFPATASGGTAFLRALGSVLPAARFCPTGGVTADNASEYLALPNVGSVGGSWITPQHVVDARDWAAITALARAATRLGEPGTDAVPPRWRR
jgi:2-dehydro-3-deoxyphosphogluconate aldolase / (4S)-4-hydroxy-2-oxoglutarate aldolase